MRKAVAVIIVIVGLLLWAWPALAGDIVTMPTANQVGGGDVDLGQYYINYDFPPGAPDFVFFTTMYAGVTDWFEIDAIYADADDVATGTILNATALLLSERKGGKADVVLGGRDLGENLSRLFNNPDFERGVFLAAAKTLNPPPGPPTQANCPIWRLHLGVGTNLGLSTDLDHPTRDGLFGGVQALVTPKIGAIALWDGTDHILGVTYTPTPKYPTFKGGVFGDHWWLGVSYTFTH